MGKRVLLALMLIAATAYSTAHDSRGSATTSDAGGDTNWTQLALPRQSDTVYQVKLYASTDGYIYFGTNNGTWRASTNAATSNPSSVSWTELSNQPTCPGGSSNNGCPTDKLAPSAFTQDASGNVIGAFGLNGTGKCAYCVVAVLNAGKLTWGKAVAPSSATQGRIGSLTVDASGNLWAASVWNAMIMESTNDGASWSTIVRVNGYATYGQPPGAIFVMDVINGTLYWGGEGGLMASPLTNFSATKVVASSTGYSNNLLGITSSGGPGAAATEILNVGRTNSSGYMVQRESSGTWSDVDTGPQYWTAATQGAVASDPTAHTYYIAGSTSSAGGVYKSTDGGQTWNNYTGTLDRCATTPCVPLQIVVSPYDDSKFVSMGSSDPNPYTVWVHP
jgi:hypothetical protein